MVLEIGPGSTPHPRANEFLEMIFESESLQISQRGGIKAQPVFGERKIHYYDGSAFPFEDRKYDYVICSHVIEHVTNPELFISEINRVSGGRGYIEYPLITYEYIYNFNVHTQFIKLDTINKMIVYMPKSDTPINIFKDVSDILRCSLEVGWGDLCQANQHLFFEGFEFLEPLKIAKAKSLSELLPARSSIKNKSTLRRGVNFLLNKFNL